MKKEVKDTIIAELGQKLQEFPHFYLVDVEKAVKTIRSQIKQLYGEKSSKDIQVLYGGSIQPSSAADYSNISGIDGLLVGGASINLDKFSQIVEKVYETTK
jgi:triosephosphate isomerase